MRLVEADAAAMECWSSSEAAEVHADEEDSAGEERRSREEQRLAVGGGGDGDVH